jgi:hypothetical protein
LVKIDKEGTIILGVDAPKGDEVPAVQGALDLQHDPASLRDLAARLRDEAAASQDRDLAARLSASADEAEGQAESIEVKALWTAPATR